MKSSTLMIITIIWGAILLSLGSVAAYVLFHFIAEVW